MHLLAVLGRQPQQLGRYQRVLSRKKPKVTLEAAAALLDLGKQQNEDDLDQTPPTADQGSQTDIQWDKELQLNKIM